jgi:hypothetical protein
VPHDPQVSLCVQVAGAQASSERGSAVHWTVSAWTTGGNVPDAKIRLQATPTSGEAPGFSSGCGKADGTSACDLGAVDAKSAPRQLQAQLTVPLSASTVKSVRLTVIGSTAHLTKAPTASATVSITAPPANKTAAPSKTAAPPASNAAPPPASEAAQNPPAELPAPVTVTSPLPVGSLPGIPPGVPPGIPPGIPPGSPTLSPGGNAASLFPTLHPKPSSSPTQQSEHPRSRPVANTSALPAGAPVVGAQLAGLIALALALIFAVTRLSLRRRPTTTPPGNDTSAGAPGTEQGNSTSPEAPKDTPPADEK